MTTSTLGIRHLFGFLNSVPGSQNISHNRSSLHFAGSFLDCLILSFFLCPNNMHLRGYTAYPSDGPFVLYDNWHLTLGIEI